MIIISTLVTSTNQKRFDILLQKMLEREEVCEIWLVRIG